MPRNGAPVPPPPSPPLSPIELFAGKEVLITGVTGFLAKVMLSMLLERFSPKRLYILIRPQPSKSARERFFDEVIGSEMMEPLRRSFGASFSALIDERVEVLGGDISDPGLGLDAATLERLRGSLDLVVNSAGLVTFNPPLDSALEVNAIGARNVAELVQSCAHAGLVHVSTCFVAGNRSGHVREDEPVLGTFPRKAELAGTKFDWQREVKDLERAIQEIKSRTEDAALESRFRQEAVDRLKEEGREVHDRTLRAAITNQRRRWVAEELIRVGLARAQHWGWPNIYTYTKALGEQAIAGTPGLRWAIVRPSIVESSVEYPFRGWNEGMNTSAPLAYLGLNGQVIYPTGDGLILDLIPVDYVASAIIAAGAAVLEGATAKVYQACTGDVNPSTMARVVTLVGLYKRRLVKKDEADGKIPWWRARIRERTEPLPLSKERYQRFGAPALHRFARSVRKVLDDVEPERYGPFSAVVSEARKIAREAEEGLDKVTDAFDLFLPFIYENHYLFRSTQTRGLFARMSAADRALLPYWPEKIEWREYWLDVHLPGLERWVFPKLEVQGPKRVPVPRAYRDLAELFQSRTEQHARRVAFRILRKDDVAETFTYRDVRRAAEAVAEFLKAQGVGPKDRVMLASESRPEWGMSYFGVILAGATCVPVDVDLSIEEIGNIARASGAKGAIASDKLIADLERSGFAPPLWSFERVFASAHEDRDERRLVRVARSPDDLASIIFTSGTTGRPKGVMLSDRNFTGLTARISALFELHRNDSLLSVLPLHHTFEFSTGFLMPLAAGASVTYLEERTPELLTRAFHETPVTAMVGVPAVWESLHRKVSNEMARKGRAVETFVHLLMRLNRWLRDHSPWNLGRWVFNPVHEAFGGRIRMMVSGGAALDPRIQKDLRGFGFNLYEGYGLTEAAPVLTVAWPGQKTPPGSVGWPLPGIEVKIDGADESGVGEVIARGPTIMSGYLDDPESSAAALRQGWLHTGDQGRLDDAGRLTIVGRKKDVIIDTGGKNVYPDEVEALYSQGPYIKELSVVGIPADQGTGERVAALVVPDYDAKPEGEDALSRELVREKIREHFREVGSKQPLARRVKVLHFWDKPLPRTSTKKIKRPFVRDQILRLERTLRATRGNEPAHEVGSAARTAQWVKRTVAAIAQRGTDDVFEGSRLVEDLGFDSLMQLELLTAVESEFPAARVTQEEMASVESVGDILRLASRDKTAEPERAAEVGEREEGPLVHVPKPVAVIGKAALGVAQRLTYEHLFNVEVEGFGNIPANTNFIVASNHTSHLDMGLVKHALGGLGGELITLAAKDYFFDDPLRRAYFENFTNLLPMDRHGSLKKSLRLASEALSRGSSLLIFPEGTRSRSGEISEFKPAIGYLALNEGVDVLPVFLSGTHDALPVGAAIPKGRTLKVRIGPPLLAHDLVEATKGKSRAAAYRLIAQRVEQAVKALAGEHVARMEKRAARAESPVHGDHHVDDHGHRHDNDHGHRHDNDHGHDDDHDHAHDNDHDHAHAHAPVRPRNGTHHIHLEGEAAQAPEPSAPTKTPGAEGAT